MISPDSVVVVSEDLTTADLGGEAIVLDVKSGNYFGLNEVGAFILETIRQPQPVRVVVERMLEIYDATPEQILEDVLAFLNQLKSHGLVEVTNEHLA
ncbi:PqqD family protein [Rhodocaloribacter litoris]|uniref:PqqD family protein n=1 Tax=Rhodocaloribacter litoris TaxID=2558931 RepID=UPI00142434B9|nr:PqqD family protein [Rhodocaloribacter litoris]QXD16160.1 PqqD family protein [Rhodocaloribacter litoris]